MESALKARADTGHELWSCQVQAPEAMLPGASESDADRERCDKKEEPHHAHDGLSTACGGTCMARRRHAGDERHTTAWLTGSMI